VWTLSAGIRHEAAASLARFYRILPRGKRGFPEFSRKRRSGEDGARFHARLTCSWGCVHTARLCSLYCSWRFKTVSPRGKRGLASRGGFESCVDWFFPRELAADVTSPFLPTIQSYPYLCPYVQRVYISNFCR